MKLPLDCNLVAACGDPESRGVPHPWIVRDLRAPDSSTLYKLVATDGRIAVLLDVDLDDGDLPGTVPPEVIDHLRKHKPAKDPAYVDLSQPETAVAWTGARFARPAANGHPDVLSLVERMPTKRTRRIAFDVKLLVNLARALGADVMQFELADDHWNRDGTYCEKPVRVEALVRVGRSRRSPGRIIQREGRLGLICPVYGA